MAWVRSPLLAILYSIIKTYDAASLADGNFAFNPGPYFPLENISSLNHSVVNWKGKKLALIYCKSFQLWHHPWVFIIHLEELFPCSDPQELSASLNFFFISTQNISCVLTICWAIYIFHCCVPTMSIVHPHDSNLFAGQLRHLADNAEEVVPWFRVAACHPQCDSIFRLLHSLTTFHLAE